MDLTPLLSAFFLILVTEIGDITAVMMVLREVLEGRAPIEFIGYDRKHPEKWRPSKITEDVTDKKERFKCAGIRVYMQADEQQKRRVGGRR